MYDKNEGFNIFDKIDKNRIENLKNKFNNEKKITKIANILGNVKSAISLSYIAKTYFDKGAPWLMQRINGNMVNGKPAAFTTAELMTLANGLEDLGKRLLSASNGLHESI